ncbi:DUF1707 SHOCT-like domain-containing protein [Streptacidiphilus albus]|uniref:DUF1707 SHOCT-like domain-containing protein n=1 Tax=Streptacidiphilus albus TaxID=105425 RepID=UPI0005A64E47|nr:DUF1707 domain-containing protein [Streptacidiphilus albus]
MSGDISPAGEHPTPRPAPELRASHADRDRTVDTLRIAAGDGRLTSDELDERLEAALSARTVSELTALTLDLPPVSSAGATVAQVKDVLRIDQRFSAVRRVGPWVVPRRMELTTEWCEVTLDFTQAVITQDTLRIDLTMRGKNLTIITRPGIVVDTDALTLEFSRIRVRRTPDPGVPVPVTLRVELVGMKSFGRVLVRPARRTFRRSPPGPASLPPVGG